MSIKADKEKLKPFLNCITAHAFNKDKTRVAVSPNSNEIFIYDCSSGEDSKTWVKLHTLVEHSGLVSDIDWSPVTDLIVSSGHDRNAYVWKFDDNQWKPTLCVLRINRAATSVHWSPCGKKFAVTSGSKTIPVCYYEPSSDWWVAKMIKKHKSTIVSATWSPDSHYLITSSTDMRCRIVSAFDKNIDSPNTDYNGIFDEKKQVSFGEVLAEYQDAKAWVNTAAWSPSGKRVCFFGHGSTAHFVDLDVDVNKVQTVFTKDLPMLSCSFLDDNTVVAAGFDKNPAFFVYNGSEWAFKEYFEKADDKKAAVASTSSATSRAFAMFQQADSQGKKFGAEETSSKPDFTTHKNTITCLKLGEAKKFTTSGLDGRIIFWDAAKLSL